VGGASQMPYVRRLVSNLFGKRTRHFRPYDAVARGACRFLSSQVESLYDYIQHDYAIKGYSPQTGTTVFTPLVPRCTAYPTAPDFKKMTLKATRDGQRFFGVDIYEIAEKSIRGGIAGNGIVFTPDGAAVFENGESFAAADTEFWINEGNPTFIEADPPAQRGVKRFALTFRVDSQKHLRVTVRDILTQKLKYDDYPVVKLK
jgi:molecular chaperone DnaK (HSP70)